MKPVIFDTGPLVAWLCPRDEYHAWVRGAFDQIPPGGLVCEAVLAEVCYLVAKEGVVRGKVIEFVQEGGVKAVSLGADLPAIRELFEAATPTLPWTSPMPASCAWRNSIPTPWFAPRTDTLRSSAKTSERAFRSLLRSLPEPGAAFKHEQS